jgi:hypothetical protein
MAPVVRRYGLLALLWAMLLSGLLTVLWAVDAVAGVIAKWW